MSSGVSGFLPDLIPFFQGAGEVVLDLEGRCQAVGEERERGGRENVVRGYVVVHCSRSHVR